MHAITLLRIYLTEEAGTPQKQLFLIMTHTFKQGEKGSVRHMQVMCLAFPHYTANERSLLEEECQSVRTKIKTSRSGKACRVWQEQSVLQAQEILQQCF